MKPFLRKVLKGIAVIMGVEFLCIVAMIIHPAVTEWMISFMALVLLFGMIAFSIAFFLWFPLHVDEERARENANPDKPSPTLRNYKRALVWIMLVGAVVDVSRSLIGLMSVSPGQWHWPGVMGATEGLLLGGFLVFLALRIQRSIKPPSSTNESLESASVLK